MSTSANSESQSNAMRSFSSPEAEKILLDALFKSWGWNFDIAKHCASLAAGSLALSSVLYPQVNLVGQYVIGFALVGAVVSIIFASYTMMMFPAMQTDLAPSLVEGDIKVITRFYTQNVLVHLFMFVMHVGLLLAILAILAAATYFRKP